MIRFYVYCQNKHKNIRTVQFEKSINLYNSLVVEMNDGDDDDYLMNTSEINSFLRNAVLVKVYCSSLSIASHIEYIKHLISV